MQAETTGAILLDGEEIITVTTTPRGYDLRAERRELELTVAMGVFADRSALLLAASIALRFPRSGFPAAESPVIDAVKTADGWSA